ncbi:MAG: hypothetical protein ACI4JF_09685, partial [Oscillospiraceae bacterium]
GTFYMENYKYKVMVELDDSIILNAGRHDLDDTYRIVRKMFTDKGLHDVSEGKKLIFISKPEDKDAYGIIGAVTNTLYRNWVKPYLKVMEWHNADKGSVEDLLKTFKACEEKYGV